MPTDPKKSAWWRGNTVRRGESNQGEPLNPGGQSTRTSRTLETLKRRERNRADGWVPVVTADPLKPGQSRRRGEETPDGKIIKIRREGLIDMRAVSDAYKRQRFLIEPENTENSQKPPATVGSVASAGLEPTTWQKANPFVTEHFPHVNSPGDQYLPGLRPKIASDAGDRGTTRFVSPSSSPFLDMWNGNLIGQMAQQQIDELNQRNEVNQLLEKSMERQKRSYRPCPIEANKCRDLSKCGGRAASVRGLTPFYEKHRKRKR